MVSKISSRKEVAVAWAQKKVLNVKNFFMKNRKSIMSVGLAAGVVIAPQIAAAAGTDLLTGQSDTVNGTFGEGSSIEKYFYVAEVIMSLIAYFKARSPVVFMGLLLVIVFTRIGFSIIGS
ncbi:type IV conjugative transfer system pilin TraA [Rouxiella badensis]|uniref:type IV conjugative transfer system pilin TraA n=1 Tax=Rouxiella badensis TaxID=1646377 RepID=UPI0017885709|nr:type IV conjugative transfer system pilin TraA [Rouxiella badensis]QOI58090.1 TraA protein [Rouxiella badensis subsp. acadiensis]